MKLSIGDIKFSESGYASTNVEVETGTYPFLPLSICTMRVSVPLVEGKALEQYKEELLAKARERIASMYKEIVCDGEINDGIDIIVSGKLNGEYKIRVVNKNGKLSVAGAEDGSSDDNLEKRIASIEKQLSSSLDTGALNAIYAVGKKAAEDLMGKRVATQEIDSEQTKKQTSDESIEVRFPAMKAARYESKGDSFFDSDRHERIGGDIQIKLPSGELAILYYEEDLDLQSTFEDYSRRATEFARKSIKAH
ncbi:hypothetical protein L2D25_26355 [Salmonella enterica subsp. enterica serovar Muenchen]|uniref:hypothetical protein n=1 Tax=Salmonella enterica TaxID=28901 RepID=UPI001F0EDA0E|nr:hypothetical protein [Salmonella enterica]MCH5444884.1 hypothetical protein [Salmonella enterica subsp. enterica serovar Muenchen]